MEKNVVKEGIGGKSVWIKEGVGVGEKRMKIKEAEKEG